MTREHKRQKTKPKTLRLASLFILTILLSGCGIIQGLEGLRGIGTNTVPTADNYGNNDFNNAGSPGTRVYHGATEADSAIVAFVKGDIEAAEYHVQQALATNPNEPYALLVGGIVYEQLGRPNRSRQHYEDLMILNAQQPSILSHLTLDYPKPIAQTAQQRMKMLEIKQSALVVPDSKTGEPTFNIANPQAQAQNGMMPVGPNMAGMVPVSPPGMMMQGQQTMMTAMPTAQPAYAPNMQANNPQNSASAMVNNARKVLNATVNDLQNPLFTTGDRNTITRFITFKRLAEEGLITREEFYLRRQSNLGGLLHQTHAPPAEGLEKPVPSPEMIVERLRALKEGFELRSITAREHAAERSLILDAVLPANPRNRAEPPPPPQDLLSAAEAVRRLEVLNRMGLVTAEEMAAEKQAIEKLLQLGGLSPSLSPHATDSLPAKKQTAQAAKLGPRVVVPGLRAPSFINNKPAATSPPGISPPGAPGTGGIGVHLASYSSKKNAVQGWMTLQQQQPRLGGLSPSIYEIMLDDGRKMYRLIAGSFDSQDRAKAFCATLGAGQYCQPVALNS